MTTNIEHTSDLARAECVKLRAELARAVESVTEPHQLQLLIVAAGQYAGSETGSADDRPAEAAASTVSDPPVAEACPACAVPPATVTAHGLTAESLIGIRVQGVDEEDCFHGHIAGIADGGFLVRPDGTDPHIERPLYWNGTDTLDVSFDDLLAFLSIPMPEGKTTPVVPDAKPQTQAVRPMFRPEHFIGCRCGVPNGTCGDGARGEIVDASRMGVMVRVDDDVPADEVGKIVGAPWLRIDFDGNELFSHFGGTPAPGTSDGPTPDAKPEVKPNPARPVLRMDDLIGMSIEGLDGSDGDYEQGPIIAVSDAGVIFKIEDDDWRYGTKGVASVTGCGWHKVSVSLVDLFEHFGNPLPTPEADDEPTPGAPADAESKDDDDETQEPEAAPPAIRHEDDTPMYRITLNMRKAGLATTIVPGVVRAANACHDPAVRELLVESIVARLAEANREVEEAISGMLRIMYPKWPEHRKAAEGTQPSKAERVESIASKLRSARVPVEYLTGFEKAVDAYFAPEAAKPEEEEPATTDDNAEAEPTAVDTQPEPSKAETPDEAPLPPTNGEDLNRVAEILGGIELPAAEGTDPVYGRLKDCARTVIEDAVFQWKQTADLDSLARACRILHDGQPLKASDSEAA